MTGKYDELLDASELMLEKAAKGSYSEPDQESLFDLYTKIHKLSEGIKRTPIAVYEILSPKDFKEECDGDAISLLQSQVDGNQKALS